MIIDEKINKCLKEGEANLEVLKLILRDFTAENYSLIDEQEFATRATIISLLQENLKILVDEYYYNPRVEARALLMNENSKYSQLNPLIFCIAFGENNAINNSIDDLENKDLFPARDAPLYVQFDKNDVQISKVTATISQSIPVLKEKMENVHLGQLQQSENLARLSKRNAMNYAIIRNQPNSLKQKLYKIRHGRKFWVDVFLFLFFI